MTEHKAKIILNKYLKNEKEIEKIKNTIKPILQQIEQLKKEQKKLRKDIIEISKSKLVPAGYTVELKEVTVPAYNYVKVYVAKI